MPRLLISVLFPLLVMAQDSVPKPARVAAPKPRRTSVTLLGQVNASSGEGRRNENVQFNLVDNNAQKETNVRVGTTATLIQEFRPERGYYTSEYGVRPTTLIHAGAAPAAALHGNLWWTHSNSVFAGRSFFQVGDVKPARENDWGFALSRRIWRGGSLTLDGNRRQIRGNVNGNVLVPRADERTALATDPAVRAVVQRFLDGYPAEAPNRTDINERALNTNAAQRIDDHIGGATLDQKLGAKDRVTARYGYTSQRVEAFQFVLAQNPDTTTRAHDARLTWGRAWSASSTLDASARFDRAFTYLALADGYDGPGVTMADILERIGGKSSTPQLRAQNTFHYAALFRQVRGRHAWTVGGEAWRRQINGWEISSLRGTIQFRNDFGRDAITNLRLGIPAKFSGASGFTHRGYRETHPAVYLGDRIQVNTRLTVNLGLRYEPVPAPSEVNGFDDAGYGCSCKNVAPRFGFALRLGGWAGNLRGAYGMHYGEILPASYMQVRYNPPWTRKYEIQAPNLLEAMNMVGRPVDSIDPRVTPTTMDPNLHSPNSHQYNLIWEPNFSKDWRLQLGYVGSRTHGILLLWYHNRAVSVPGIPLTTATIPDRRPDQSIHEGRRIQNASRAYYDAARATLLVPRWRGFTIDASYWFSKAIDLGASYDNSASAEDGRATQSQTELDLFGDLKGLSRFDQPHAALVRATWSWPRRFGSHRMLSRAASGWELSGIVLAKSGTPFTVTTGADGPGFGNVDGGQGDRPNILDPSILGRTIGHPDTSTALLPRPAFGYIRPGEQAGNIGVSTFRKGRIANVDAALSRTFTITGERKMEFRAESLNFFNTPQFAEPSSQLVSPSFGFITNTLNDGRAFRFTLRFIL